MPPLLTAVVDCGFMLALATTVRRPASHPDQISRLPLRATATAILFTSVLLIASRPMTELAGPGVLMGTDDSVLLQPRKWLGRPLPIVSQVQIPDRIESGHWRIVLVRNGCDACSRKVEEISRNVGRKREPSSTRLALIEVGGNVPLLDSQERFVTGTLSPDRTWLVKLPTEIVLQDGVVIAVDDGDRPG